MIARGGANFIMKAAANESTLWEKMNLPRVKGKVYGQHILVGTGTCYKGDIYNRLIY